MKRAHVGIIAIITAVGVAAYVSFSGIDKPKESQWWWERLAESTCLDGVKAEVKKRFRDFTNRVFDPYHDANVNPLSLLFYMGAAFLIL